MSNVYCDLDTFKDRLNITGTSDDTLLLAILEHASRAVDDFCNRSFFIQTQTRYYDGSAGPLLLDRDLIAVTSLKTDDDESGDSWETTWAATDYELLPYNGSPKHAIAVTPWGAKSGFNPGLAKTVEIAGRWGYDETYEDSGADINEGGSYGASDTTLTVTDGAKFAVGQTVLIDSEQLFISAISTNDLTVERGANGTTAATHADASDISIYRYPRPVVEACAALAERLWKRKDAAAPAASAGIETDHHASHLLAPFRRTPFAAV